MLAMIFMKLKVNKILKSETLYRFDNIRNNSYKLNVISMKILFMRMEQDSQCKKWERGTLDRFECSKTEPTKLTKEIFKKWNNGTNCREKCLEYVKVMGDGCCEAKLLSIQTDHPNSTKTKSSNNLYQTECIFRSGSHVKRIKRTPSRTSNEDNTLACEGRLE